MRKVLITLIICGVMCLTACSSEPSESDIQTAIANTNSSQPTLINTVTKSPTVTKTILPSMTATATNTITPSLTLTPTITNTATPIPPATLTQKAIEENQTEIASFATSTQSAINNSYTATSKVRTRTASANYATATEMASYEEIYWKELATYPSKYTGQKVVVRGRVFNILGTVIQIYFAGTYEALYVTLSKSATGIYENDSITVYGIVAGKECFENAYGAEICQPALKNAWFTKP